MKSTNALEIPALRCVLVSLCVCVIGSQAPGFVIIVPV